MRTTSLARLRAPLSAETGQTMPEYGVVLGTVVIGCVLVYTTLTGAIVSLLNAVVTLLP
jgi:Flp pilus assembly pilin Flp